MRLQMKCLYFACFCIALMIKVFSSTECWWEIVEFSSSSSSFSACIWMCMRVCLCLLNVQCSFISLIISVDDPFFVWWFMFPLTILLSSIVDYKLLRFFYCHFWNNDQRSIHRFLNNSKCCLFVVCCLRFTVHS